MADNARLPSRFTKLIGCRLPLQLAAMGGVATPALAGSVAAAGGLGMLAGLAVTPETLRAQVAEASEAAGADRCIGVGFLMPFLDPAGVEVAAETARLVEFFYGEPAADLVTRVRAGGALVSWQVGSPDEAHRSHAAGCDLIVAQGIEAGGHVRGSTPLLELLDRVGGAIDVPIIAAGGLGTAQDVRRVFDAGADAVRIGTRFLATPEADVHPDYLAALAVANAEDTELTEAFAAGWPDAPHRVLRSSITASDDAPSTRLPLPPSRDFAGDTSAAALYAGHSVGAVTGSTTVSAIVAELFGSAAG